MRNHWQNILNKFQLSETHPAETGSETTISPLVADILQVKGVDSRKFLQGQTTCNMDELATSHCMPGAICDPKGRMITSFSIIPINLDNLLLTMSEGLAATTLTAIQKYSAFYKTELIDVSEDYTLTGICGNNAKDIISHITGLTLSPDTTCLHAELCSVVRITDTRYKLLARSERTEELWTALSEHALPVNPSHWRLLDIRDGIGEVQHETTGLFIPQMLNLQARGGISFRKGCYTGQEIVARMKYLGKLKRRMYLLKLDTGDSPAAGTPCFEEEGTNPKGHVVSSEPGENHTYALAVLTEDLAEAGKIRFAENNPVAFELQPLPYPLDQ